MKYLYLFLAMMSFSLSGCSTLNDKGVYPYFSMGIGYQMSENSDWYLRPERDWTCNGRDRWHGEIGLEFKNNYTLGYHHQSGITCGGPFNNHPELYEDEIVLTKRWGGRE